jgi:hypothetical protein
MDHAALQTQVAACVSYAGLSLTHAGGTITASLERVSIEDLGVEVPVQSEAFRITWSGTALSQGTILTNPVDSQRYRIATAPTIHPITLSYDAIVEPIST